MTNANRGKKALVIGGGIAGPVTAMALRKAGLEPVIFEAYGRGADGVGAFLTLAGNGVRALRALDLDERVLAGGFATPRFAIELGDGRPLGEMTAGAATMTIRRADLYGALRDEARARGVAIQYGKRLVDAGRRASGAVHARFEDGTEAEGDLLIAADGLHSRVRALLDPRVPPPSYLGLLNAGGYARGLELPGEAGTMHMVFGKRCFLGWVKHPDGSVWWFANPARAEEPSPAALAAITKEAWRAELSDLFSGDASPGAALVEASPVIFAGWPTYDLPRVPVWHRDRMLLIGDAAHAASPSSGQGASMAIEDAVTLGRCLRDAPDVDEAFAAYERARRDRVERVVAQGRRNGTGKTPGPFGRAIRDLGMRMVFRFLTRGGRDPNAWIHEHTVTWDG